MADLFSELHRRHPDVDLVLLPPAPPPPSGPEASDDDVAATFSTVVHATRQLWSSAAPDSDTDPLVRWSYDATPGRVRAVGRVVDRRTDGFHLLVGLRHELESNGWDVTRPAVPDGGVERLVATLDDLTVAASYAERSGALVLTVESEPLLVGAERVTALVRRAGGGR